MDFLLKDNVKLEFNKTHYYTEICITLLNNNINYKGVLPNKISNNKFNNYNLATCLQKHIVESNVLNVDFDYPNGQLHLYLSDVEFENNQKYNSTIKITLDRIFTYDKDFENNKNIPELIQIIKSAIDYHTYLENKIINLENKINEMENDDNDNDNDNDNRLNYSYYS